MYYEYLALRLRKLVVELASAKGFESGIHTDLGFLLPERRPVTWSVQVEGASDSEEGGRLKGALVDCALPWFESARTESGLMAVLSNLRSMDSLELRAILYSDKQEYGAAQEMLDEIVRRRPDLSDDMADWAEQRGLFRADQ